MKKVKIMLTAVAVLVAVGGAFAFKAKKGGAFCIENGTCQAVSGVTIVPNGNAVRFDCSSIPQDCTHPGYLE
jgi:hypothetical protein